MGIGMWTGKITVFDDQFVVLKDADGMSLLKIYVSALWIGLPIWR